MRLFTAIQRLKALYPLKAPAYAALALSVLLLAGCGQKGDLYQPENSLASGNLSTFLVE